jgi:hypothetical protein
VGVPFFSLIIVIRNAPANNLNLNKMDSDDDGFAKQGGEALDLGEDFDSEEEADDDPAPPQRKPMPQTKNVSSGVP